MADAIQSFLETYGQSDTRIADSIPHTPASCCCGNATCAYLKHNQGALEELERDVRTAAKLGQALLMRHEAYIADSEKERKGMMTHIESLELEKQALEKKNSAVIEENRGLLDQLEAINSAVADSDTHVTNLQATLHSTQLELQRLSHLAARTERLEQQLADYEREQAVWQASLDGKEESEKSAVRRWQKAERTLADLEEQIERIEREAKEEKERHVEVVGRMERRHAVEKELNSAAGRLKGAAAAKTSGRDPGGTNVVSHFVKDILSDNANLQMGIVELREMLQNSNDEVDNLRKQLFEHQPAPDPEEAEQKTPKRSSLRAELTRATSQELHVHHHYHAPTTASKTSTIRKPKKKRYGALTPGHFTPPTSGYSTPRSSISFGTPSSAATILQQTAVSIPHTTGRANRFSTQSNQTYRSVLSSSGPSSPQSTNRTSSLFDHVFSDAGHESSRPTSPETEDPGSPMFAPMKPKPAFRHTIRTKSAPIVHRRGISPTVSRPSMDSMLGTSVDAAFTLADSATNQDAIPEENEGDWQDEAFALTEADSNVTSPPSDELLDPIYNNQSLYKPSLRRAASHESLLSVSGMDIHTLQTRPSQLLMGMPDGRSFTSGAVISDATAHAARPAAMSRPEASGRTLLNGVAAEQRIAGRSSLGSKVGGWVFGRWGATPAPAATKSNSDARSISSSNSGSKPAVDPEVTPKKAAPKMRMPGINQSGPIVGFLPEVKRQYPPVMSSLDEDGLTKALGDGNAGR